MLILELEYHSYAKTAAVCLHHIQCPQIYPATIYGYIPVLPIRGIQHPAACVISFITLSLSG